MGEQQSRPIILTIGHSNQPLERFIDLLRRQRVDVLVDVRSQPHSKYAVQFDARRLKPALIAAGFTYLYLGEELGGRPKWRGCYDAEGHVLYGRLCRSESFLNGIQRLESGVRRYRIALMCSEENPAECHRHLLLARVLDERGVEVQHIRGDGGLEAAAELRARVQPVLPMFEELSEQLWRSPHPVAAQDAWPAIVENPPDA